MVCPGSQVQGLILPPSLLSPVPLFLGPVWKEQGWGCWHQFGGCSRITCILSSSLGFLLCHGDVYLIGWFLGMKERMHAEHLQLGL